MYPLFVALAIEALCIWVLLSAMYGEPQMIDGRPDNAPMRAAPILGFLVAVLYAGYAALVGFIRFLVTPGAPDSRT